MPKASVLPEYHSQGTLPGAVHSEKTPYTTTSGQIRTASLETDHTLAFFAHNNCILGGYLTVAVSLFQVSAPQHLLPEGQSHKQKICVSVRD
jgi:hypothetical protein